MRIYLLAKKVFGFARPLHKYVELPVSVFKFVPDLKSDIGENRIDSFKSRIKFQLKIHVFLNLLSACSTLILSGQTMFPMNISTQQKKYIWNHADDSISE